jgi:hypothetical protein
MRAMPMNRKTAQSVRTGLIIPAGVCAVAGLMTGGWAGYP